MFLLKNSVEKIYGPSGTGNMPPDRRCLPNRGGRNDQPASFASRSWGKRRCEPFSGGGTPFASAGTDSRDAEEPERIIRNDTPRSRSDRRGKYPGTEAAIGKDRCFILAKIATSERVRGIFFFPRLFLDSPPGTPYLVCVMNFHHKIRHH